MRDDEYVPPHSSEAEQFVIGAVLLDNMAFDRTGDLLAPDDFYHPDHRAAWSTVERLIRASKPADVLTMREAGGHDMAYMNSLVAAVPSAMHSRHYALIVRQLSVLRATMRLGAGLAEDARRAKGEDASKLIDKAVTDLLALQHSQQVSEPQLLDALLPPFIDNLQELAEGKNPAVSTGFIDLDRITSGGGRPGELWVIGARPSMGKTALVLNLSRTVGEDHGALVLTQEDSNNSLVARQVAAAGRLNLSKVRRPDLNDSETWERITEGAHELSKLRVSLDDQTGLSVADVRRKVQQVKRRDPGLMLVIVDYLQLMEGDGDNRNQMLGQVSNGLKKSAKELGVWIVLLSQLNREADKRTGPPQMADLRDSGDIEGAADLIGLLHREFRRKPTEENKYWAQLHVAKNKNGPTDTVDLWFDGETQRFENWQGMLPTRGVRGDD